MLTTALIVSLALLVGVLLWSLLTGRPWLMPWVVVVEFSLSSELRLRTTSQVGVLKDLIVFLLCAVALAFWNRRREGGQGLVTAIPLAFLVLLYVLNLGGSHGATWIAGVRLLVEAILIYLAAVMSPEPRRTVWHLTWALVSVSVMEAIFSIVQQSLGEEVLVFQWGYQYGAQVRSTTGSGIRVSGTFEDPFQLAALSLLTVCVMFFYGTTTQRILTLASCLTIVWSTQVRTLLIQLVVVVFLFGFRHRQQIAVAISALAAGLVGLVAGAFFLKSAPEPGRPARPLLLGLNGRTDAWGTAGQGPHSFLIGNGVGEFGSGRGRFSSGVLNEVPAYNKARAPKATFSGDAGVLDSSYLQALSDVGLLGIVCIAAWLIMVILFARRQLVKVPDDLSARWAWVAIVVVVVSAIDWVGRTTMVGFTTGWLTMYVLGIAIAAAGAGRPRSYANAWHPGVIYS